MKTHARLFGLVIAAMLTSWALANADEQPAEPRGADFTQGHLGILMLPNHKIALTDKGFPDDPLSVTEVSFRNAVVDHSVLNYLSRCKNLKEIDFGNVNISDRDLALLLMHIDPTVINLDNCDLTDQSIATLGAEKSLTFVSLTSTAITWNGLKQLRKLHPTAKFHKGP